MSSTRVVIFVSALVVVVMAAASFAALRRPTEMQCERAFDVMAAAMSEERAPAWLDDQPELRRVLVQVARVGGTRVARELGVHESFVRECVTTNRRWRVQRYIEGRSPVL